MDSMPSALTLVLALLLPLAHAGQRSSTEGATFSNAELGFSFTPPLGMQDFTNSFKEAARRQERVGDQWFSTLLWLASGSDTSAGDWAFSSIATFPRGRDKDNGDDVTASFITNVALAHGTTKERVVIKFSGYDFAVSRVERPATSGKYAIVYTTVRNETFLTFVFGGNDREKLEKMAAASMNTLKFAKLPAS